MRSGVGRFSLLVVFLSFAGCGSPPEEPLFPVSGTLKVDGVPAAGATIRFHPLGDPNKVDRPYVAQVETDGTFSTAVQPAGDYAVTVSWPEIIPTKPGDEKVDGEDRFKGKYDRLESPATKVNITAGENKLPLINLKRK